MLSNNQNKEKSNSKNKDDNIILPMKNLIHHAQLSVTYCLVLAWQQVTY